MAPLPPISNYPPVMEDLAFEVEEDVLVRQVQELMQTAGGELVTDVELFDIYRGEPLAVNHKSIAFRLTYQSAEKSLGEKEITQLRRRIMRRLKKRPRASCAVEVIPAKKAFHRLWRSLGFYSGRLREDQILANKMGGDRRPLDPYPPESWLLSGGCNRTYPTRSRYSGWRRTNVDA
ncbi:MAG: hypothetical protein HC802_17715 [Caldilineaceae bacterium]|nr:hypothetical protein [Caldilineaceae bacterium]